MRASLNALLFSCVIAAMALLPAACKKGGDDEGSDDESSVNRYEQVYGDTPPIDCQDYARRVNECPGEFLTAYATTERATQAGEGDGQRGAEYYQMGLSMLDQVCEEWYANRDPHWHARYNECLELESCAEWAACAANAVGNPIGPPEL